MSIGRINGMWRFLVFGTCHCVKGNYLRKKQFTRIDELFPRERGSSSA